jgi:hypothetical protein
MSVLLNLQERMKAFYSSEEKTPPEIDRDLCKAQLLAVIKWGDEQCPHHPQDMLGGPLKWQCGICRQSLKGEVK